jgi:hypothetical protein
LYRRISCISKVNTLPFTRKTTSASSGYVCGPRLPTDGRGADSPDNMQWQTVAEAKAKDQVE